MDPEAITAAIEAVARGLATAHENNVLHLDIKPGNSFQAKDGRWMIGDWGTAIWNRAKITDCFPIITPRYVAPELLKTPLRRPDMDQYPAGVMLYEAATGGYRPHDGKTDQEIIDAKYRDAPAFKARIKDGDRLNIMLPYEPVARRAFSFNHNERFSDMGEFADAVVDAGQEAATRQRTGRKIV